MSVVSAITSRVDSWVNALTGLGTLRDKVTHAQIAPGVKLTDGQLEALFNDDDLAKRIINKIPREALRRGFTLNLEGASENDDADIGREMIDRYNKLRSTPKLREAWIWGRLYNGGAIFIGADDGQRPDQPLNEKTIRTVEFLNVLKRPQLKMLARDGDITSPTYNEPTLYELKQAKDAGGMPHPTGTIIHASRMIMFDGTLTARTQGYNVQDGDWGDSVLQSVHDALRQTATAWQSVAHLISDASQGVLKIENLVDLIATDGQEALRTRIQMMDLARSVCRSILVDAERESFERIATSFAGLPEMMDRMILRVAAAAEMPVTMLFGRSPAGLNATGESDIRGWYDTVSDAQTDVLKPRLERLLTVLMLAKDSPTKGTLPKRWEIEFNPLWQPTEKEQAEVLKIKADTHVALVGQNIMMETESALALAPDFPTIDVDHRRKLLDADLEAGLRPSEIGVPDPEDDEDAPDAT